MFLRVSGVECLILLIIILIVAGFAFRGGYFRGRRNR